VQTHWTAVADALPDSDTTVLVANPEWMSDPVGLGYHDGEVWRDQDGIAWNNVDPDDAAPTHWADLPEPPEGGAK
jgi:hypothetical protein